MKTLRFTVITRVFTILAIASVLLLPASAALAAGGTSYTQTVQNTSESFVDYIPCTSQLGTITTTYNGVFHINFDPAGDFWLTGTETGSVSAVPLDSSQPTYSGHFTIWFNENDNLKNENFTVTFSAQLTGSDGSTITYHEVAHLTVNANGTVTTSFDKPGCGG